MIVLNYLFLFCCVSVNQLSCYSDDQDFLPEKRCGTKASFKNKDISKKVTSHWF